MDDEIRAAAEKLAGLLVADARFTALRDVENDVLAKPELKLLMEEYEQTRLSIARKERAFTPIEPEEKRAYADLGKRVQAEPLLITLAKAQAEYAAMMEVVNRTIHDRLSARLGE